MDTRLFNLPNRIVAVTGGIASGKSTFCKELEDDGQAVFYADKIVKRIYETKGAKAMAYIILDGYCYDYSIENPLDFGKIRERAFKFPEVLTELEEMIGEYFEGEFLKEYMERGLNKPIDIDIEDYHRWGMEGLNNSPLEYKDIYIEHPLVYKMNMQNNFDDIIMMEVEEETQLKRIIERDGCSEETAKQMIERQRG